MGSIKQGVMEEIISDVTAFGFRMPFEGREYISMIEHLPSMCEVLG